jgi:hypothetical protein
MSILPPRERGVKYFVVEGRFHGLLLPMHFSAWTRKYLLVSCIYDMVF